MRNDLIKVGVIGPTDISNLSKQIGKPEIIIFEILKEVGKTLADSDCELWVNSDKGTLFEVARAYKEFGGKKLVILYPKKGEPWPKAHAEPYTKGADVIRREKNWFWCNYNVVSLPDICVCVGFSPGVFSELAYINWDKRLKCGNLKMLIGIAELLRGGHFPYEFRSELGKIMFLMSTRVKSSNGSDNIFGSLLKEARNNYLNYPKNKD